jgi:hypothetical protein
MDLYTLRAALTMEETFILTGVFVLLLGGSLGFLWVWLTDRADKKKEEKEED